MSVAEILAAASRAHRDKIFPRDDDEIDRFLIRIVRDRNVDVLIAGGRKDLCSDVPGAAIPGGAKGLPKNSNLT